MKESNQMLEKRIKRAIEQQTPDVWPGILRQIEEAEPPELVIMQPVKRRRPGTVIRRVGAVAAALALVVGGWSYMNLLPRARVGLDVNPSIELSINRADRVLSVTPLNDDARVIIDGMELKNTDLNVAVNALIGSMVKHGFLSEIKNSILITVDSQSPQKGAELRQWLTEEVSNLVDGYAIDGAILSQTVSEDDRLQALAETHGISLGKAALVDLLVSQDDTLEFASIAALPINDINLLIASRSDTLSGVESKGQASSGSYLKLDDVKGIVFGHAGVERSEVSQLELEFNYRDGRMVYEVEFKAGDAAYAYQLDAMTGDVLGLKHDAGKETVGQEVSQTQEPTQPTEPATTRPPVTMPPTTQPVTTPPPVTQPPTTGPAVTQPPETTSPTTERSTNQHGKGGHSSHIGSEAAIAIALSYADIERGDVTELDCELDEDHDMMVYEIELKAGERKIECTVDAGTGAILEWDDKQ